MTIGGTEQIGRLLRTIREQDLRIMELLDALASKDRELREVNHALGETVRRIRIVENDASATRVMGKTHRPGKENS